MGLLSRNSLVRLGIGAIMLLLVLGGLAPRPARAGCDHPFGVEIRGAWSAAHLDPLITGGGRAMLGHNRSGVPGRPLPCSGPTCSGRVPLPASSAPSVVQTLEQWGLLPGVFDLSPPVASAPRDDETLSHLPAQPTAHLPPSPIHGLTRGACSAGSLPVPRPDVPLRMGCLRTRQSLA